MQSKLEELARKEEELRKINEALDVKKTAFMAVDESAGNFNDYEEDKSSENSDDQFKGKNLAAAGKHKVAAARTDF